MVNVVTLAIEAGQYGTSVAGRAFAMQGAPPSRLLRTNPAINSGTCR